MGGASERGPSIALAVCPSCRLVPEGEGTTEGQLSRLSRQAPLPSGQNILGGVQGLCAVRAFTSVMQ